MTKIKVDVLSSVQDFYPGLSVDDAELIAQEIVSNWDYSEIYNAIADDISHYADANAIDLEGKDGYEIETDNIYVVHSPKTPLFP